MHFILSALMQYFLVFISWSKSQKRAEDEKDKKHQNNKTSIKDKNTLTCHFSPEEHRGMAEADPIRRSIRYYVNCRLQRAKSKEWLQNVMPTNQTCLNLPVFLVTWPNVWGREDGWDRDEKKQKK